MCPYCRTNAPLVYRGLKATCAACGAPRMPMSGSSLTHAGRPSAVGGTVVRVFGWASLGFGLLFALLVGLVLALFSVTSALVIGGALAILALVVFLVLRQSGKTLQDSGKAAQDARREQAVFALAQNRGGKLQAMDAASALDLSVQEADAFLTQLAKQRSDVVGVDIGDNGEVFYTFTRPNEARAYGTPAYAPSPFGAPPTGPGTYTPPVQGVPQPRVRVDHPTDIWQAKPRARVAPAPTPTPSPAPPDVIDAELEAIDEAERAARQRR